MDMSLPGIDGWEASRQLKADAAHHAIRSLRSTGTGHGRGPREGPGGRLQRVQTKPVELSSLLAKSKHCYPRAKPKA